MDAPSPDALCKRKPLPMQWPSSDIHVRTMHMCTLLLILSLIMLLCLHCRRCTGAVHHLGTSRLPAAGLQSHIVSIIIIIMLPIKP
jgi:hypothetical protein